MDVITELKQFLAGLIHAEALKIKEEPFDQKKLMASNGWEKLPEKIIVPIFVRDALVKVMNFIEHTPPAMNNPASTNLQKLEELSRNFMDDYQKWLIINEKNWPVPEILNHLSSLDLKELDIGKKDEEIFSFFSSHLIQRYYLNSRVKETPEPEPEAA